MRGQRSQTPGAKSPEKVHGAGGSRTVIRSDPGCSKPFDITWDDVIIQLALK
jgi:hypothetical protein